MEQEALLFGDYKTANLIVSTQCPTEQKRLGRTVVGFNQLIWDDNSTTLVHQGNYNKFNQNPSLLNTLEATVGSTLVETSPYDSNWGIALKQGDPHSLRRKTCLGHNRLGQILTDLKDDIFLGPHTPATTDATLKTIHAHVQEQEQGHEQLQEHKQE